METLNLTAASVLTFAAVAATLFVLMFIGASHARLRHGKRWVALLCCLAGLAMCWSLAAAAGFAGRSAWSASVSMQKPPGSRLSPLDPGWGRNLPPEDRTRQS